MTFTGAALCALVGMLVLRAKLGNLLYGRLREIK
jgi:hypothetical protein